MASFKEVSSQIDSNQLELDVLDYWEKESIFEKSLEQNKDKEEFVFFDGPPYATGKPHYGHILQSTIKDTVLRYKSMRGHYVPRRVGWDTHGLPVEVIVEKELGFKNKKDIEEYGIEKFNAKCKETVTKYVDEFTASLVRLGRWADYDDAYFTFDRDYMETEWGIFQKLWQEKLVYQDFRSTPYCIRCETPLSNHEVSMAYKDKHDQAVYIKLKVADSRFLLVWTTTPWTLPANVAVAFSKDVDYVVVQNEGEELILAKDRVEKVLGKDAKIITDVSIDELKKLTYEPLYPEVAKGLGQDVTYSLVEGDHVTAEDGTGLVHMAPAFGQEDAEIGKKEGLPTLRTIGPDGRFINEVKEWAGEIIWDANPKITKDLDERGILFKKETYKHSYPFCWRCDEPLIYYALDSWFVGVTKFKDELLANNEKINWVPEHVKGGRFGKGLESAPDWAVSRNRFWSVPLPIWQCVECKHQACVGSVDELKEKAGVDDIPDIHRPFVDTITFKCEECSGEMKRVEEVLDVWFDSGSMPYATDKRFPADFIVEAIEMTRAWFYVLHVLATAVKNEPAFRNVIASGIIFDEKGRKLSKKLKNYKDPEPMFEEYGADTMRLYFLTSSSLGEPYRFSEKDLKKLKQNVYLTLWNVYSFFVRYANTHEWKPGKPETSQNILDKWILARVSQLENEVVEAADSYHIDTAARAFVPFIDDLSNWYVRRSRNRFQRPEGDLEMNEAFSTLHEVLVRTSKLVAPFMPFIAEDIYRNLVQEDSVHLTSIAEGEQKEGEALEIMSSVRAVVTAALAKRAEEKIKVRQPLSKVLIKGDDLGEELTEIIKDEVNVKQAVYDAGQEEEVILDIEIKPELKQEGMAREIIRHGQQLRRKAGYQLDDNITLLLKTDSAAINSVLESQRAYIFEALQATELLDDVTSADEAADLEIETEKLTLGVKK